LPTTPEETSALLLASWQLVDGSPLMGKGYQAGTTAIEAVVDRISEELHPLSKIAKDAGSAAQLVALLLVGIFWLMALNTL